ncbi:hypothetical protein ACIP5Y_12380 [Nocardia sp. NPDC088792]|uniref:hypothetical protein n=1 Tax=Nocardia sp. NPDC088792 TaxID=3364332 RepID=UPI003820FE47
MLFDIRTIVGALLGVYGIILIITSYAYDPAVQQAKTGGVNINLWSGLAMLAVGVCFLAWVRLSPPRD